MILGVASRSNFDWSNQSDILPSKENRIGKDKIKLFQDFEIRAGQIFKYEMKLAEHIQ